MIQSSFWHVFRDSITLGELVEKTSEKRYGMENERENKKETDQCCLLCLFTLFENERKDQDQN